MNAVPARPIATIEIRKGEGFDPKPLVSFLRQVVPGLPDGPVEIRQFPTGASNLTYWIRIGGWEAVLRRPPIGPVPPKAHDMVREGNLLRRLHPAYPLAPEPYAICAEPDVLGVPFHVMEYRRGVVIDREMPPEIDPLPVSRRAIGIAAIETLADLHLVDWRAAGLEGIGRPDGFLARQVEGWVGRYSRARTDDISEAEPLIESLRSSVPVSPDSTVIHNDFKLNNLLIEPGELVITAVLDWEMATLGDPLLDLGVFLGYWADPSDPPELRAVLSQVTTQPGFPRRAELIELYTRRTGRDTAALDWYLTFAYFKLAVILQQIYARWVRGQTADARFAELGGAVATLVRHAYARVQ